MEEKKIGGREIEVVKVTVMIFMVVEWLLRTWVLATMLM